MATILRTLVITSLLLLSAALAAWAEGPVWRVSKGDAQLFIGGTIHMLSPDDFPLPEAFDRAYSQASRVVFETDMELLQSPEFQQRMLKEMILSDGQSLKDVLRPATLQAVTEFASRRGIAAEQLQRFRPAMLVIMLTVVELQRLGLAGTGVDQFYLLRARQDRKELGQLESVDEQLAFLVNMAQGREDAMVMHSLDELAQLPVMMQQLRAAWRQGDEESMAKVALAPWKAAFPEVYDAMLVQRNRAWLPQLEMLLKSPEVELVLVGALHLVGEDGILRQLAARGYRITPCR